MGSQFQVGTINAMVIEDKRLELKGNRSTLGLADWNSKQTSTVGKVRTNYESKEEAEADIWCQHGSSGRHHGSLDSHMLVLQEGRPLLGPETGLLSDTQK